MGVIERNYYRYIYSIGSIIYALWGVASNALISPNEPIYERAITAIFPLSFALLSPMIHDRYSTKVNSVLSQVVSITILFHYCTLVSRSADWGDSALIAYTFGYLVFIFFTGFVAHTLLEIALWCLSTLVATIYLTPLIDFISPYIFIFFVATMVISTTTLSTYTQKLQKKIRLQQDEAIKNSNLVAIGKMSSILSHEVNNNLQIINSLLFFLGKKQLLDENKISRIRNSNRKVSNLLYTVYTLANDRIKNIQQLNVSKRINDLVDIYKTRINELGISISIFIPKEVEWTFSQDDFSQAFLNILKNAIDAADKTENKEIIISYKEQESTEILSIENSGSFLDKNIISKMYDPFFTTKEIQNATGIGLTLAKKMIERNHSFLYYEDGNIGPRFVIEYSKGDNFEQ
jgi:signal transduction histidine kinase